MDQYYNLVELTRETGVQLPNRTGIDTIMIPGAMLKFDMKNGFPLLGGRFTPFKSMLGELCGFYRAAKSAATFRELGSKVWDKNANDPGVDNSNAWLRNAFRKGEDDLGPIYGEMWRNWPGYKLVDLAPKMNQLSDPAGYERYMAIVEHLDGDGWKKIGETTPEVGNHPSAIYFKKIDQLGDAIRTVIKNPSSRRIIFHGWNPSVLDEISLPACHLLYQLLPNQRDKVMHMSLYIRSSDQGLGLPYNISQAAAQLKVICRLTGYTPGTLTVFISDAHIYVNQLKWLDEQIDLWKTHGSFELPSIVLSDRIPSYDPAANAQFLDESGDTQIDHLIEWLSIVEPSDFSLVNYKYHTLKEPTPPMAV